MRTILFGQPEPIIETYLEANDLWEAVEENYDVLPLPDNPTLAQIRNWKERKARNSKAKAYLFSVDSKMVKKIRIAVLERFQATIHSLENTKDLSNITLI